VPFSNNFRLSYKKNNISFKFNSISFKSGGEIIYRYRMNGLDEGWKETRINQLSYPSLPPGEYELSLFAINKFGKQSDTAVVKFSICAPYWKTTWFWLIIATLSVVGAAFFLQS